MEANLIKTFGTKFVTWKFSLTSTLIWEFNICATLLQDNYQKVNYAPFKTASNLGK